jgi:hypothetical protein
MNKHSEPVPCPEDDGSVPSWQQDLLVQRVAMPTSESEVQCADCGHMVQVSETVQCLTPEGKVLPLCLACARARVGDNEDASSPPERK